MGIAIRYPITFGCLDNLAAELQDNIFLELKKEEKADKVKIMNYLNMINLVNKHFGVSADYSTNLDRFSTELKKFKDDYIKRLPLRY